MSPYAADHNLLPHLQNIQLHAQVLPPLKKRKEKKAPDLPSEIEKQLQHQTKSAQHTSQMRELSLSLAVQSVTG